MFIIANVLLFIALFLYLIFMCYFTLKFLLTFFKILSVYEHLDFC